MIVILWTRCKQTRWNIDTETLFLVAKIYCFNIDSLNSFIISSQKLRFCLQTTVQFQGTADNNLQHNLNEYFSYFKASAMSTNCSGA